MRIFLEADHLYPAYSWKPAGEKISVMPSCGPQLVHDLIAEGLADKAHDNLDGYPDPRDGEQPHAGAADP